jgi:hypothetical protein
MRKIPAELVGTCAGCEKFRQNWSELVPDAKNSGRIGRNLCRMRKIPAEFRNLCRMRKIQQETLTTDH